ETHQYWQHRLNRSTKILQPRINLTFRQFKFS
ncbi:alpha-ketoglutarate-dependent dioxygenase AlkB, partial [Acinetobacter baumannii]